MSAFGTYIRAGRLGYGWCEPAQAFVRISGPHDGTPGPWRTDVARTAAEMAAQTTHAHDLHRCWWDSDKKGHRLWEMCHALRTNVGEPGTFWADEDGYAVASPSDTSGGGTDR